jgi:fatty acid desaturase
LSNFWGSVHYRGDSLFRICSILTWSNYGYFEASHAYHHRHTLQPGDAEGLPHPKIDSLTLLWILSFDLPGFMRRLRILGMNAAGIVPSGGVGGALFPPGSKNRDSLVSAARMVLAWQLALALTFALLGA